MKDNLLHLCFVIDESGSMWGSEGDVLGGFNRLIEEQKAITSGECIVSLYRFENTVRRDFLGKPLNEVEDLQYHPGGGTAMNDGIGRAIYEIGEWLNSMDESERPSKNMIVIMTDGEENASREYTLSQVRDMIKHQEEKYDWSFVYMGSDLNSLNDAESLGIKLRSVSSKSNIIKNYSNISCYASAYRYASNASDALTAMNALKYELDNDTAKYEADNGISVQ